jgi:hypothetical protein
LLGLKGVELPAELPTPAFDRFFSAARGRISQPRPFAASGADDRQQSAGIEALADSFGLDAASAEQWPTAAYCLSVDDPAWDRSGFWLHADPVHLRADRDQLRLFDGSMLAIRPEEARELVAELNAHFSADGIRLHATVPERWYLRAPEPVDLRTRSLRSVIGATLAEAMPSGAGAKRWNALMNEAQMLMHQSAVNQARAEAGRAAINGLWLSGAGTHAPLKLAPDLRLVISEDPLALGLARAGDLPTASLETSDLTKQLAGIPAGRVLLVEQRLGDALRRRDLAAWSEALQQLDRKLQPMMDWILNHRDNQAEKLTMRWHDGTGTSWSCTQANSGSVRRWLGSLVRRRATSLSAVRAKVHSAESRQ